MDSVSIKNLCFSFHEPGQEKRIILDNANLVVQQKEALCICGQSGQGKSTLLRILAGLAQPHSGQIFYSGIESEAHEHTALQVALVHKVAFVFQNAALISNLRVFDNVALPIRYHQPHRSEASVREQVTGLLASMMVDDYANYFPYALSAGILRRVAIARALALEPRILLMDEPTTGLDVKNRRSLLALIANQRSLRHATIIMVTHDLPIAKELDARICFLHKGILSETYSYDELGLAHESYIRELVEEMEHAG
ncbi:MAG TPA: ATP-binding cassette domain-containing protein [Fibrobacteraceae bacterium]|nr:ATP-binding cassette domain-containing protein [Fibrobacteraceae bacterium]